MSSLQAVWVERPKCWSGNRWIPSRPGHRLRRVRRHFLLVYQKRTNFGCCRGNVCMLRMFIVHISGTYASKKGPMDILTQTLRNEGFFALYKGSCTTFEISSAVSDPLPGMLSPLVGIAGVNSLLFASYAFSKRIISPYPEKSLKEIAGAGAMAGAANAILASPGKSYHTSLPLNLKLWLLIMSVQLKCSKCGCRANMVGKQINGYELSLPTCGRSMGSVRVSCEVTGYASWGMGIWRSTVLTTRCSGHSRSRDPCICRVSRGLLSHHIVSDPTFRFYSGLSQQSLFSARDE